jgi:hypothetical protein
MDDVPSNTLCDEHLVRIEMMPGGPRGFYFFFIRYRRVHFAGSKMELLQSIDPIPPELIACMLVAEIYKRAPPCWTECPCCACRQKKHGSIGLECSE